MYHCSHHLLCLYSSSLHPDSLFICYLPLFPSYFGTQFNCPTKYNKISYYLKERWHLCQWFLVVIGGAMARSILVTPKIVIITQISNSLLNPPSFQMWQLITSSWRKQAREKEKIQKNNKNLRYVSIITLKGCVLLGLFLIYSGTRLMTVFKSLCASIVKIDYIRMKYDI